MALLCICPSYIIQRVLQPSHLDFFRERPIRKHVTWRWISRKSCDILKNTVTPHLFELNPANMIPQQVQFEFYVHKRFLSRCNDTSFCCYGLSKIFIMRFVVWWIAKQERGSEWRGWMYPSLIIDVADVALIFIVLSVEYRSKQVGNVFCIFCASASVALLGKSPTIANKLLANICRYK